MELKLEFFRLEVFFANVQKTDGFLYFSHLTKAVSDFESALKIRPNHKNANKYLIETMVAQARLHLDEGRIMEAREVFVAVLAKDPDHKEAKEDLCKAMIASAR